jgi:RHS repeat-associated protein
MRYPYSGTGYANPDAPTQIANGVSTTTFSYDNNGNVTQKTVDGTTTTYLWDYANRLIALGVGGATTTYGYDWAGNRVIQTGTSTTSIYPFKWYSIASSTGTSAKYSTTTEFVFNGDTLVSTIDQQLASGAATGSAKTRFIHPDHLGSTNVVTDASGTVVQTLDYYPYGSTRITSGQNAESRQYIGQFSDQSTLSYLNARYYEGSRGQFLSQDPVFLGDPKQQNLQDPQTLNSYSYAEDNPIVKSDPSGRCGPICVSLVSLFDPSTVGDPVFGPNGSISSTPQQLAINTGGFVGLLASGNEELGILTGTDVSKLTETIGVNPRINEVTSLPERISKGGIAAVTASIAGITWLVSGVNGWDDNPTNADLLNALFHSKKILEGDGNNGSGMTNLPKSSGSSGMFGTYGSTGNSGAYKTVFSSVSGTSGLPPIISSAASKGYGSSGTVYTSFVAPNAFSACGTLCK